MLKLVLIKCEDESVKRGVRNFLSVPHCHLKGQHQHSRMGAIIKTRCCECGQKLHSTKVSKSKLYCCSRCQFPHCPRCMGVDIVYKVAIFNGKKKTLMERCLNVECLWRINKRNTIEVITIDN